MGTITQIVLHCSDSTWGTAVEIDRWHRARGWERIGYLGVILNGYPLPKVYWEHADGAWEWGRPCDQNNSLSASEQEAHALGINANSVGICLIGTTTFSVRQLLAARQHIRSFCALWHLPYTAVIGHCEVPHSGKTCPNLNMSTFRSFLVDHALVDDLLTHGG